MCGHLGRRGMQLTYNKLVQKSFSRLMYNDLLRNASSISEDAKSKMAPFSDLSIDESYQSRDLEKVSQQIAKPLYDEKVQPITLIPKQIGNSYTASLYSAFVSLIHNKNNTLTGDQQHSPTSSSTSIQQQFGSATGLL